jgi:hypothetical protein
LPRHELWPRAPCRSRPSSSAAWLGNDPCPRRRSSSARASPPTSPVDGGGGRLQLRAHLRRHGGQPRAHRGSLEGCEGSKRAKSTEALPRARSLSARAVLEKVRPAPSARSQHGFPALLKAVEAAIVCRRIVKGTPGARRSGARSAASDQEQEREADNRFSHCRFFRRSGGTLTGSAGGRRRAVRGGRRRAARRLVALSRRLGGGTGRGRSVVIAHAPDHAGNHSQCEEPGYHPDIVVAGSGLIWPSW